MKLFFKKLLIFIVVTLICTMEIDATNIVTQYFTMKYECVNARSINTTKVNKTFKNAVISMGDSIRVEKESKLKPFWHVPDTVNKKKIILYAY